MDLAEVAFTAWAESMAGATNSARGGGQFELVSWQDLDDGESRPWIAVEQEFVRLRDSAPIQVEPVVYRLREPLPGVVAVDGAPLRVRFPPRVPTAFTVRTPTAADCLAAEEFDGAEREDRIIYACMEPVKEGKGSVRWTWSLFGDLAIADLMALRRLVFTRGPRLDGLLYEAWRSEATLQFALEMVRQDLHPEDAPAFLALERAAEFPREELIEALAAKSAEQPAEQQRWVGEAAWPPVPSWADLYLSGNPNRYVWSTVAWAMATASDDGIARVRLFSPGVPREIKRLRGLRAKDVQQLRRGETYECKMIRLIASLTDTPFEVLERVGVCDYEMLIETGMRWWGNLQREMATTSNAS